MKPTRAELPWKDVDLMIRTQAFNIVLAASGSGVKLTALRKQLWPQGGRISELFRTLETMVRFGLLQRDDTLGDNTYKPAVSVTDYCNLTGEMPLNVLPTYCTPNWEGKCVSCRCRVPKRRRVCSIWKAYRDQGRLLEQGQNKPV